MARYKNRIKVTENIKSIVGKLLSLVSVEIYNIEKSYRMSKLSKRKLVNVLKAILFPKMTPSQVIAA